MTEFPGYCTLCRSRCGSVNHVEDGKLIKVTPLAQHPTGGALCAKGRAAPELLASPKRLTTPMRRTAPRDAADPGWIKISWDEALEEITRQLLSIRASDGAEAVAFAVTTPSGTPMVDSFEWVERLVRCFGSPNMIYAIEVCGWHKDYAQKLTFGRGIGVPDWDHTDVIVLWGHNPARTWLAQASRVAQAKQRGARVIVIDPKQDGSGQQADLWLRIRPGADGALAIGAIRHLIETHRYDADFVRRWTNAPCLVDIDTRRLLHANELWPEAVDGALVVIDSDGLPHPYDTRRAMEDAHAVDLHARSALCDRRGEQRRFATVFSLLADAVAIHTTEHVAALTWIDASSIEQFNALFEGGPRLSYHSWTGVGQHTNASATERAIGTLYALTGACDAQGGNVWTVPPSTRRVNDYDLLAPEQQAKALGLEDLPLGPPSLGWITARDFAGAVLRRTPYAVRALVSFGSNLLVSQADSARNRQALQALDFHVHIDPFMNPTAQSADIVLPSTLPWEHEALKIGFEISQAAVEHVQLRPRMLTPLASARTDYEIALDLAVRMGMGDRFFGGDIVAGWNYQLEPLGVTVDTLRAAPTGMRFPQAFGYRKYAAPAADGSDEVKGFDTPSRRVELYSESLLDCGQSPLATFVEPAQSPLRDDADARYPLVLTTAKTGWYVHSSHRHIASLRKKAIDPMVQIGAGLAAARGIAAGDWTQLSTPYGHVVMRAKIDDKLDDRTAIADFGWWQGATAFGREDTPLVGARSANINGILSDCDRDPVSGSVPLRATLCNVQRHATMNRGRWTDWRTFRIVAHEAMARNIARFEFAPVDGGELPDFQPGQHLTIHDAGLGITRAYSLVSGGKAPRTLSIAVKRDGRMSSHLHGLAPGALVELGPPGGTFAMPTRGDRPLILLGSGIGITPFISYLEAIDAEGGDAYPGTTLHYVCRDSGGHAFAARIREIASKLPRVRVVTYYRAPRSTDTLGVDYDRTGDLAFDLIDDDTLARRPLAYLCGSGGFLETATRGLVWRGMPAFDVFAEMFKSEVTVPTNLVPQRVTVSGTGKTFAWRPDLGTILEAADAASVPMPSGCRVGQCESCLVRVVRGTVLHLQPYDGPADGCLTCQAVPLDEVELAP
ncbi:MULTISPECIES: molybdopterin-dependent oxidoreductase [Paraburkholderia]|uniref:Molybdopterin-dependent oxidoreductase n=1 Tax=Paraburkholderia podalyriae TaxID=1938811 RepID=A0ABR7PSP7_9BURK|nr:molybdopterin-dependent oxidoreductase [Paraburkholderia podalyriae]MBC8749284.1 molybdopterin-dependent oxidoreductase [Paraburkholderia podalyriae]